MNFLPDIIGYGVGAGGSRARRLGEGGSDFFLTHREVIRVAGEVSICVIRGQGGRKKMVEER